MRVYSYRYITGGAGEGRREEENREQRGEAVGTCRCACKRVKRRDIFYIYGYLPLLCSRAGGLWQKANRPPSFSSSYSLLYLLLLLYLLTSSLSFSTSNCALSPFPPQCKTRKPAAGPCVISGAIPYSVPTMICSRLVPCSRWISFIGVHVVPYLYIDAYGAAYGVQPTS